MSPGAACQPRVLLPCSEHAGRSQATLGGCAPAGRVPGHPGELGGDAHSEAFLMVTSKRTASHSVSRPLLFSCHPEPLQGRLCARAISGDPFLSQATHPGVTVGMTKEEQSRNCLRCTRRESRHCVCQPHSPTPKYCCVVPGVWDFRTKGRSLIPGVRAVFTSCPCLRPGTLAQGGGEGFKLGTGENLLIWLVGSAPGGQATQQAPARTELRLLPLGVRMPDLACSLSSSGSGDCWTGCPMGGGRGGLLLGRSGNPVSHKGDAGGGGRGGARHGTQGTLGRW